jgi:hypothetical protein
MRGADGTRSPNSASTRETNPTVSGDPIRRRTTSVPTSSAEEFVSLFVAAWGRPDSGGFAELWLDEGVFVHPTVAAPLRGSEVPRWSERIKAALADFTFQADEWAAREDLVLLQWTSTATLGDRLLRWSGVDRFRLREWRIAEEVVYFDTLQVWTALDPTMMRPPLIDLARG